jgi:hypothetical protein
MTTILIDHLSQAYTRGVLHEQRKAHHLVPTGSILADSDPTTGRHPQILTLECEASKYLVCSSSSTPIRSHAVYSFRMTTGGIDESLPRPFLPVDMVHQIMH